MSDSASDPGRLAALRRYEILDTPAEPAFDRIADLAAHLLDTPMAGIHFVDDQCQWAKAQVGLDAQMLDLDVAFCAHALDMEEVLVVEDAAEDPRFRDNPLVTGDPGIRFYAGAALITPDGYALGRLCVIDTVPRPSGLGAKERETLRQLAGVVMDELAYRAQPRRREEMLESITDAFFAVDDDWRITYLNQQAEVLLDRSREALLGQDLWGAFPEAKELAFYDAYHRAMQTGEPAEFEAYFPPLQTWFEVKAFPMEQGGLAVYYNDVTARHEREEALKKSQMLLKTSQRIAHLGHWDWDVETGAVEWSDETFRLFGYEPGALDPTVEIYFEALPAPDRERVRALSRRAITAGRIRPEDGRIEHRIVRPDGTERIVELEAQILESDAAGRPTRVLGTVLDVTRRRERKEQLRLMSRAVEEATEAVIITGPALDAPGPRIEYVNPAFEQMTGYAAEEVIGQTPRILQGPATDRATLDDVRSCLEQGDAVPAKTALNYRKDGTPYWVEWNITPVRGPDGTVQHWVSVQRDVTEQRQRQDALRQERNLLARIFEASAAAISVVDTNGQITRANGRAEEVLGLDPVTVTGRMYDDPAWEIEAVDGGPFPDNELPFVRVMATGAPVYDVRHAIAWPDGQRRILSINGAPLQDQAGAVVGVVFAITDVTEQHERAETLQNERQRLALALTGGNLGMWDVNFNEGRNIVDERWAAMLGYSLDEMRDCQPPFESHVHPDDLERTQAAMERHARGEIPYVDLEIRMRHKDGSWRWILDRGKIVEWNDDGSPRRAVGTHMDVTERKNAERELRRQRDLLRQTQRLAGAWEHDLESGVIHWSEEVYRILEWPPDKPVHLEQLLDLFLPKARTQLRAAIQAAIEDGVPYDLELPLLTLEGTRRWVRAVGAPTRRGGEVVKLAGALQDITERKETEEEIRRQRDLLENIFDASPAAIVTLNAKGQFTSASARGQEVLGLAPAAVSGRAFNDPEWRITDAHGRSMPVEELPFARVLATDAPTHDVEMSIERSDGTRRLLSVSGAPLQGANGQPDGAVFVLDDITEKKRRTSMEQRLGQLLKATPSEIYVFDAETLQFVQTSRGARRNLGYAADELATMTPLDLKPYDRADFEAQLQPLRTDTEELVTFETTHRRKDGTTYPVEVRLQLSREETRPVFIAIALDITERTRRERELVDAKERAEEMSRLKSAFLANMSHEIRTPLTSIIGFADVLGGQVEGTTRELIGMIRESGKRLEETLTSVLDLAKIEGESMRVRPDRVDLAEEVRTAAGIFRPKAEAKGLNLEVDVPTGPTAATLDPRVLRRILSNLVSNAVKFTSEGRVTVRLRPSGDNGATIEVEDTGIGIAEEQMTHIFDEFVQESAGFTREYEGVGLGLSITRRLVQLLGGTVEAESEKGRGSIFRVRLPREHPGGADGADELPSSEQFVEDAPPVKTPPVKTPPDTEPSAREETDGEAMPPLGARPEASPAGERTAEGDTVRILLVEDNALTRRVLPMLLQKADARYTMDVVERGEDALKQAEARGYDLFIIDINLGAGLTGLDVMRRLRKLPRYAQTPMVACTAYAMPGDEEQFLAAGFDAYLAKPFRAEDLLTALARAAD